MAMRATDVSLERIFSKLRDGNVGQAIAETEVYLAAWPNPQTLEKLNAIKADYLLLVEYWRKDTPDPQRSEQYQRLLQRVYVLCANISIHRHITSSSYLQGLFNNVRQSGYTWSVTVLRQAMERFVSEAAMLELEPENKRKEKSLALYKSHQQLMNALFNYILTGHIWTEGVGEEMTEMLLSPTVDNIDQQLLVSAIMLSLMNHFDMVKFRLLVQVYRRSNDENVRQRALVGWALSIDDDWLTVYPEVSNLIHELLQSKKTCRELFELQIQLIYTLNAEKDSTKMEKEIMPELMEHQKAHFALEEDPLEDVLHPDAAEERMEQLEASFNKIVDMQKQGADIYFGSFSRMKRVPFFYDISNWFVPFYRQHPDISQFAQRGVENRFLENVLAKGALCESDKYSFFMTFQQMVGHLSPEIKEMMSRGEIPLESEGIINTADPACIRRCYLMDMYRFFRVFPNRSVFYDPFKASKTNDLAWLFIASRAFWGTPFEKYKHDIMKMLKKRDMNIAFNELLNSFSMEMHDVQYFLWYDAFEEVLKRDPNNEQALVGLARQRFLDEMYEEAEQLYDRLLLLFPDKVRYQLNKAVCQINLEQLEEALRTLYQLNFEHPDDLSIQRMLAWALTADGKLEQAERMLKPLVALDNPKPDDLQNLGYCLWLQGRIDEATEWLRKYRLIKPEGLYDVMERDYQWLQRRGISQTEIKIMEDLIER